MTSPPVTVTRWLATHSKTVLWAGGLVGGLITAGLLTCPGKPVPPDLIALADSTKKTLPTFEKERKAASDSAKAAQMDQRRAQAAARTEHAARLRDSVMADSV